MRILFCILFFINIINCFSQDTIITKVIIFDQDDISDFTSEKGEYKKNALKINPLLLATGEIPIYFERAITNSFAIEAAIGITFKNYMNNLFDDDYDPFENENDNEEVHSNPSFKLGLRYYTENYGLEGFYFALEYAKRKYSATQTITYPTSTSFNTSTTTKLKEETSMNEFKLIVGSQSHSYWDNFFIDYYIGVGIRNQDITEITPKDDVNTNLSTPVLDKYSKSGPAFYLGFKIGFEI